MKTGVTFIRDDGKILHTYYEFGMLQLADVKINPPTAKRHIISDVPGADGQIDITKEFGPIRFENRTIKTSFEGQDYNFDEWVRLCEKVWNELHGVYCKMILDIDPEHYWEGFVSCETVKDAVALSEMTISMDAYPYKRKINRYHAEYAINGSSTVTVESDRMPTSPYFTASSEMIVRYGEYTQTIGQDETQAEFEIVEGENVLQFTGKGTVIIEWEGGLL